MKHLVGKEITKKVAFVGDEVEVRLLTVGQAREIEDLTKKVNKKPEKERDHLSILFKVIRMGVVGAQELSDEELESFPIAELTKLSQAIMDTDLEAGNA
jgi:hypothetical protein